MSQTGELAERRAVYDGILWLLLAVLLIGVLTFDRRTWPSLIGDEATYLMAAESLAWDRDLLYERHDYERFLDHWQVRPEGLILQSGDGGVHVTFGKPFFYPLWAAPFVRLAPLRGPFLANFVLLVLTAIVVTRVLRTEVGAIAPLWVAAFLLASVAFAYVFWAHADLFLMCLAAIALALAFRRPAGGRQRLGGWLLAGALLAVVGFSRPLYLPLFLPALLASPRGSRWRTIGALLIGALGLSVAAAGVHRMTADAWTSYGGQRHGFYESTGFPAVDFPLQEWEERLAVLGNAAWSEARSLHVLPRTDGSLWLYNSLYFWFGRNIGVLPYFLPCLLGLLGRPRGIARWSLVLAVALSVAGFFLYRPFNIYGGGGAIANRYFLPLYPAFWFLATRPGRPRRVVATFLLAAAFLWPLWRQPRSFPQRTNHTYRYVSNLAIRMLPFETTQSHLKPGGHADMVHGRLWVKFLTRSVRPKRDGTALLLDRGGRGQILVGSPKPLTAMDLQLLGDPAETLVVVAGAETVDEEQNARGRRLGLRLRRPAASHPMWWSWDKWYLYRLELRSESTREGRLTFVLENTRRQERDPA